jgi:hypothetical protein
MSFKPEVDVFSLGRTQYAENIIANVSLSNPMTATQKIPATIDVALEKPILPRCKDYKLAIDLFQCPLTSVRPLYLLQGITLGIIFRDSVTNNQQQANIPFFGSGGYDIKGLLFVINFFLESLHNSLTGDNRPPYIYFQPENRLFYLVVPEIYFNNPSNPIQIIFNEDLYNLFSGFPVLPIRYLVRHGTPAPISLLTIAMDINHQLLTPTSEVVGQLQVMLGRLLQSIQQIIDLTNLQAVIVTSNIPVCQETLPLVTGQAVSNPGNPVSFISTLPVLTSFRTDVNQFGLQKSSLIYFTRGQYRWIDLLSDLPLDRLSFNFYWQSTDQTIHQLVLSPGESVIARLYFRSIY